MSEQIKSEFIRFQQAIKTTMISVAYLNYETPDNVENDIDVAFHAIDTCFENFSCSDTVTRRCAKSEIFDLIQQATDEGVRGGHFLTFVQDNITCESVFEDIIAMHSDELGLVD
jgi:hypothetical protein